MAEQKSETTREPARPFTALPDEDGDILRSRFPSHYPELLAVLVVLLRESRFRKSASFSLADGIVADRAKVSRRLLTTLKPKLVEAGVVECKIFRRSENANMPTVWTVRPAVPLVRKDGTPFQPNRKDGTPFQPRMAKNARSNVRRLLHTPPKGGIVGRDAGIVGRSFPALAGAGGAAGPVSSAQTLSATTAPAKPAPLAADVPERPPQGPWRCEGHEWIGNVQAALLVNREGVRVRSFDGGWKEGDER